MRSKKAKKQFYLRWVFDSFSGDASFYEKRMFGGLSAYYKGRMVMVLTESPGQTDYRGKDYKFDIWNGILLPTEREFHESLLGDYKSLMIHPVLGKWLYLSVEKEDFEEVAEEISEKIFEEDIRFGIEPKIKTKTMKRK